MDPGLEDRLSPTKLGFNPNALSPMSSTFPSERYATLAPGDSISQKTTPTTVYSPMSPAFPYTPASAASATSDAEVPSLSSAGDARNPFNFQSVTYMPNKPQPQGNKNVRVTAICKELLLTAYRTWAAVADTSTSTAVSRIRSSSNLRRAPRSSFLPPSLYRPSRNTVQVCRKSRD